MHFMGEEFHCQTKAELAHFTFGDRRIFQLIFTGTVRISSLLRAIRPQRATIPSVVLRKNETRHSFQTAIFSSRYS